MLKNKKQFLNTHFFSFSLNIVSKHCFFSIFHSFARDHVVCKAKSNKAFKIWIQSRVGWYSLTKERFFIHVLQLKGNRGIQAALAPKKLPF